MKDIINLMKYDELSPFKDVRVHMQVLLDFFDSLMSPAITLETLLQIEADSSEKLDEETHSAQSYLTHLKRPEFYILHGFAAFLGKLCSKDNDLNEDKEVFALRVAISLLRKRKAFDQNFHGRSFIKKKIEDRQIQVLARVILCFSQEDPETLKSDFVSQKSPIMSRSFVSSNSPVISGSAQVAAQ